MINYRKPLYSFTDAHRWCLNIAEALNFMHTRSPIIIHRDIKCDNILLSGPPDCLVAKIGDFGLHAQVNHDPTTSNTELITYALTGKTGAYIYMAPEVLTSKPYNEKVDVFSFGVIMFELFSKSLLSARYQNTNDYDESENHAAKVAAGYRPPFPAFIPETVQALITRCWATEPSLRPKMCEVVEELKRIEASGVIETMSTTKKKSSGSAGAGGEQAPGGSCCTIM